MDHSASTKLDVLECMLDDESVKPTDLPLSLLEYITNSFSDDKQIGTGGFAEVYKGMLRNGTIAVKKLSNLHLHENKFQQEVKCLMKAKHKNVVRFLGYCSDTQGKMVKYNGKLVMADVPKRLLCFEYLPNGSLHEYISGTVRELKWTQCYQIIKGICTGLQYLHENHIVHLDLKPANILLGNNMEPKIADFGLSRCFDEKQSHVITSKLFGSLGYVAPEFYSGRITFKSDIYSLGVIMIEILTGEKMYPEDYDVLKNWHHRLEISHREKQLEQLYLCAEIGKECTDYDPRRRPDARTIGHRIHELDIDMSNLSIAQEEQHGDGCNLIGAIGPKMFLECLLRLSRSEYGKVASLSRDLRSLVCSGEIYRLRRLAGVAEYWIYLYCNIGEWKAYDPDRQRWIQVPKMPADESFISSHKDSLAVGTDLLVFGRGKSMKRTQFTLFIYSILTNSWSRSNPMNYRRCLFGSASVGHKAYIAGGSNFYGNILRSLVIYDCERNYWTTLPRMNKARIKCSGVFMDGKLYAISGRGCNNEELECGEEYDFKLMSWRVIENMTEGLNLRLYHGAHPLVAVVENELYAADYIEKNIKKYDKKNNSWTTLGRCPESIASLSTNGQGTDFKACGDQLIMIGCPRSSMVELCSWVPDGRPPVWNLIASRHKTWNLVYDAAAVMSC